MGKLIMRPPILNKRLKLLHEESGYSYKKLEELTGISRSSLQRYETNPLADIPLNKLTTIAEAYGVSVGYLLGTEDRDLSHKYFESLSPLLDEVNCSINYDEYNKTYELWMKDSLSENSFRTLPVTNDELKNLKETTLSYLKFKIAELFSKPPSTE